VTEESLVVCSSEGDRLWAFVRSRWSLSVEQADRLLLLPWWFPEVVGAFPSG
jgi:hypothetical protein